MLAALNQALVAILSAPDPHAAWEAACVDPALRAEVRDQLARLDPDALRLQALLVAKLRFERLVADPELALEFDADPEGFTARFRRYAAAVVPRSPYPEHEVRAFRTFEAG